MCCDREKEFDAQVSCQILKIFEQHSNTYTQRHPVRKKCLYSELFWSAFSRIWTENAKNAEKMRENEDQNNSEYGHFLRSVHKSNLYIFSIFIKRFSYDRSRVRVFQCNYD